MGPLERLLRFSLRHRLLVVAGAALLTVGGAVWILSLPVDIFPDLSAPTVTVITEAPGMAAEEVELLVTYAVESAINGSPGCGGCARSRPTGFRWPGSSSTGGPTSTGARQVVSERLQRVDLPAQAETPELGPISSIMGEITFIAMTSAPVEEGGVGSMELRRVAETVVRRTLLASPACPRSSRSAAKGGNSRSRCDRPFFAQNDLPLADVTRAVARSSRSLAAGFHVEGRRGAHRPRAQPRS